ncbi:MULTISPECIES: hypothetical protein [Microbulbifer]|uniref:Ribosomal protein L7/L12 C-terminal domain-containing protein n=1 Tax=Microbulbifer celer TaxID=435905 RepID=A0ABW3U390_9GAMM|nr:MULTISPECIES: hypothetical protein [Microbulbifer]UFN56053.1 hypothetical protein LPW13_10735 [Microbulbifer celer]
MSENPHTDNIHTENTYSVIFRGDLQPGFTVADVKANFGRLFKAGPAAVEKLFSGRPLAIKKKLTRDQAEQLKAKLAQLGALATVKAEGEPAALATPAEPSPSTASVSETAPAVSVESSAGAGASLSLAPMEGYLLKEHERSKVAPVQVPVSHLSLQPAGGNLVQESERNRAAPVEVTVPDWKLNTVATFKLSD